MTHLTDAEFVDLLDDTLPLARRTHLQNCEACREQASEMGATLSAMVEGRATGESDVPDPSPLFWEHFSARVREAIDAAPSHISWRDRIWRPSTAWAAGLAVAVAISHLMLTRPPLSTPSAIMVKAPGATSVVASGPELPDDIESDADWAVVRNVADEVDWDKAHDEGIGTRPDAAERMAAELTTREQSELARLLQRELNR